MPAKARIVIVIDASHSFGAESIAAARSAASAYISHFTGDDVEVELLAFGREVESPSHGFQKPSAMQKTLAEADIALRNGSEIGLALERAGQDLVASPSGAARRIVVLTDLRTRSGLEPERVKSLVPAGATLHIATITSGEESLRRDDFSPWAKLPRSTGGLLWDATASSEPEREMKRRRVYEELARPLRIDGAKLSAAWLGDLGAPRELEEGMGLEGHRVTSKLVSHVTLTGELWSSRVERAYQPDAAYGRRRAALAFGTDLLPEVDDAGLMRLALHGHAVTPVTSFLAVEPGVRPSVEGLDRESLWGDEIGDSSSCCHHLGLSGIGGDSVGTEDMTDYAGLLRALIEPGMSSCKIAKGSAIVLVESTLDEIVAVTAGVDGDDAKRTKASCLAEAVWAARLPEPFALQSERKTSVNL